MWGENRGLLAIFTWGKLPIVWDYFGDDLPIDCHHLGDDLPYSGFLQLVRELESLGDGCQGNLPVGVTDKAGDVQFIVFLDHLAACGGFRKDDVHKIGRSVRSER